MAPILRGAPFGGESERAFFAFFTLRCRKHTEEKLKALCQVQAAGRILEQDLSFLKRRPRRAIMTGGWPTDIVENILVEDEGGCLSPALASQGKIKQMPNQGEADKAEAGKSGDDRVDLAKPPTLAVGPASTGIVQSDKRPCRTSNSDRL